MSCHICLAQLTTHMRTIKGWACPACFAKILRGEIKLTKQAGSVVKIPVHSRRVSLPIA